MSLFGMYTDQVVEQMQVDKDSVYNRIRLHFVGRHILTP